MEWARLIQFSKYRPFCLPGLSPAIPGGMERKRDPRRASLDYYVIRINASFFTYNVRFVNHAQNKALAIVHYYYTFTSACFLGFIQLLAWF